MNLLAKVICSDSLIVLYPLYFRCSKNLRQVALFRSWSIKY